MLRKIETGIQGFDEASGGGFPAGRTSLIEGGTGTGKTVFALQCLARGARARGEVCAFVSFEESPDQVRTNAASFDWASSLRHDDLIFIDAQPDPDVIRAGAFDIGGLLAVLEHEALARGATTVVLDAIDRLLLLVEDERVRWREMARLQAWLRERNVTALVTAKRLSERDALLSGADSLQFMLDCVVSLEHDLRDGVSQRALRIRKYRGSSFEENAVPFIIAASGLDVAGVARGVRSGVPAIVERISSGVGDLDAMLDGGFFRASSILVTGAPGTAKTTLCGAFAEAACERGEKTVFVSFDSMAEEVVRNLKSVGIDLQTHVDSGRLRMVSLRALQGSAESQLIAIRRIVQEEGARVVITDPLSALSKAGNHALAPSVAERLIDWAKARDITVMCTSLIDDSSDLTEATPLQVSTIADSWLHLTYVVYAGERNRGLSIVKSRGTAHSNQVREMLLSDSGLRLEQVYSAAGEVLMGAMRWEREREEAQAARQREMAEERERQRLGSEAAELEAQLALLEQRLAAKRWEVEAARQEAAEWSEAGRTRREAMRDLRLGGALGVAGEADHD
jgi:circadian clock protein KaiC